MNLRSWLAVAMLLPGPAPAQERPVLPYSIPVLVLKYYPLTADRQRIDIAVASNVNATLEEIRKKCDRQTRELIESLQQGSRFRAYKNEKAPASLEYTVVDTQEVLEPMPPNPKKPGKADYIKILDRAGIKDYVEKKGIKEVWIWAYHSKEISPWESNMASPFGDISNSDADPNDLPVFDRTYTVYHYNYERGTSEAMENHMHQIEWVLRRLGGDLWKRYEGKNGEWRCGNAHFPPNGRRDYDWANKEVVSSDIEDWRPEGFGEKLPLNCDKWEGNSRKWFIYWMRSIPGANNGLTYEGKKLANWWVFLGDYDRARKDSLGLIEK